MFKKVIFNTASQVAGKTFTAAVSLLVAILVGRTLSEAGYGEFTKIMVFVGYFYTIADFGLNTIYIKLSKEDSIAILKSLIGLRILLALTLIVIAVFLSSVLPYNEEANTGFSQRVKAGIAIASFTILTQALITSANSFFQKKLRYNLATLAAFASALVVLATTLVVIAKQGDLFGFVFAYVLGGIAYVIVAFAFLYKKTKQVIFPSFAIKDFYQLLSGAWPIGLALIINIVYFRIDVFILSNFRSSAEVGIYGLAYQFFEASLSVPIFFANSLYPLLNGVFREDKVHFKLQIKRWLLILSGFGVLATITLVVISSFIPTIFDGKFTDSIFALRILSLGLPFFFISALLWHLIIILDKQKYLVAVYGTGALFNLVANIVLIPQFGYLAAAFTTVLSEVFITLLLAIVILRSKTN